MDIFADAERRSNQEVESIIGEVDADVSSSIFHIAALLYAESIQNLLINFTHPRYLSYGQFVHEFKYGRLITLEVSLSIWFVHIRANFSKHLIATNTDAGCQLCRFHNLLSYLLT